MAIDMVLTSAVGIPVGLGQTPVIPYAGQLPGGMANLGCFGKSCFLIGGMKSMGTWLGNAWLGMTGQAGKLFTRASGGDPSALHRLGALARKDWGVVYLLEKLQAVDTMRDLRFDGTLWVSAQMILSAPSHIRIPCTILRRQASLVDQVAFLWTAGGLDALATKNDLGRFRERRGPVRSLDEIMAGLTKIKSMLDSQDFSGCMEMVGSCGCGEGAEPTMFFPADALSSLSVAGNRRAAKYLEMLARRNDVTAQEALRRSNRRRIRIVEEG